MVAIVTVVVCYTGLVAIVIVVVCSTGLVAIVTVVVCSTGLVAIVTVVVCSTGLVAIVTVVVCSTGLVAIAPLMVAVVTEVVLVVKVSVCCPPAGVLADQGYHGQRQVLLLDPPMNNMPIVRTHACTHAHT